MLLSLFYNVFFASLFEGSLFFESEAGASNRFSPISLDVTTIEISKTGAILFPIYVYKIFLSIYRVKITPIQTAN